MPPLTRRPAGETTRKLGWVPGGVLLAGLCVGGCATQGPNHVYFTTRANPDVHDLGPSTMTIAGVLRPDEQAVGLAYDFNTDHLFVRVSPGQVIRVIERPSGKVLREMPLPPECLPDHLPADKVVGTNTGPAAADLAIRSSDRHLFAAHPDGKSVVELTLFGEFIRRIELTGLEGQIDGLAFDQKGGHLLVLSSGPAIRAGSVNAAGHVTYHVTFAVPVNPVSLGYDSDAQRYFVPMADDSLGEFDVNGKLVATHPAGHQPITAIDAGPRSFVRVF